MYESYDPRARKNAGPIFVIELSSGIGSKEHSIKSVSEDKVITTLTSFPSNRDLIRPTALAVDSKGNIFIADTAANTIFVLYPNNELVALTNGVEAEFGGPTGIALNEKDGVLVSIYVSDTKNKRVRTIIPE